MNLGYGVGALIVGTLIAGTIATDAAAQGSTIAISPASQGELASYLQRVKNTRPGAFAVSMDGLDSYYAWCEDLVCNVSNYSSIAMRGCQSLTGGQCVVVYFRNEPRLNVSVDPQLTAAGRHGSQKQYHVEFD